MNVDTNLRNTTQSLLTQFMNKRIFINLFKKSRSKNISNPKRAANNPTR